MSDEKTVPIEFKSEPQTTAVIPIAQPPPAPPDKKAIAKAKKEKLAAQLAEARIYEKLGSKVMKVSAKTLKAVGSELDTLGIKHIGHGRIFFSAETAVQGIGACDAWLAAAAQQNPAIDPDAFKGVMMVKYAFAKLLLESGEAHIRAAKELQTAPPSNGLSLPFPPNSAMAVEIKSVPVKPFEPN